MRLLVLCAAGMTLMLDTSACVHIRKLPVSYTINQQYVYMKTADIVCVYYFAFMAPSSLRTTRTHAPSVVLFYVRCKEESAIPQNPFDILSSTRVAQDKHSRRTK